MTRTGIVMAAEFSAHADSMKLAADTVASAHVMRIC
jgi:hypothetical protein